MSKSTTDQQRILTITSEPSAHILRVERLTRLSHVLDDSTKQHTRL